MPHTAEKWVGLIKAHRYEIRTNPKKQILPYYMPSRDPFYNTILKIILLEDVSGRCIGVKRQRALNIKRLCSAALGFAGAVAFLRPGACVLRPDLREVVGVGHIPNTHRFLTRACSHTLNLTVESKQQDD